MPRAITQQGTILGTFHYMAPERLTGHYSLASDIFSMAVVILEMLTGKRLSDIRAMFSDPTFRHEIEKLLNDNFKSNQVPHLAELLISGLNPEPRRRPSDVNQWTQKIAAILQQG